MSKKTLKEFITEYNDEKGYSNDSKECLFETFVECFDKICEDDYDEHRWYTNSRVVMKVIIDNEERFFAYTDMNCHGDGCRRDVGWETPDLDDDVWEVYPKEVTTVVYE